MNTIFDFVMWTETQIDSLPDITTVMYIYEILDRSKNSTRVSVITA
jgi:hypothetical protein